jgi:uridine phosphorylase
MTIGDEIVYPKKGRGDPAIGAVAVMVATEEDVTSIRHSMGIKGGPACKIVTSRLYQGTCGQQGTAVVGPTLGAPHAVMVLEKLIVLGAQRIVFVGWCGSLQKDLLIGDFVVPDRAVSQEGTSAHYPVNSPYPRPSGAVLGAIENGLSGCSIPFHKGCVWSTDAPYRETKDSVLLFQKKGVLGVDMELSALFTVADFRNAHLGALLIVSDELGSLRWRPGFSSSKFNRSRRTAAKVVAAICQELGGCCPNGVS